MKLSLEELRAEAAECQRRIKLRKLWEYAAALLFLLALGMEFVRSTYTPYRIVNALITFPTYAFTIYACWHLYTTGTGQSLPANAERADCIRFYRSELEQRRDLLLSLKKPFFGPLIVAWALLYVYRFIFSLSSPGRFVLFLIGATVASLQVFRWLDRRAARRLDRRIAELDREPCL